MNINRRGFWAALGFGTAAVVDVTTHSDTIRKSIPKRRLIAVSDSRDLGRACMLPGTKITFGGVEVKDCYRAEVYSDGYGQAWCYDRDESGRFYMRGDHLASYRMGGRNCIKIIPPPSLNPEVWQALQKHWTGAA